MSDSDLQAAYFKWQHLAMIPGLAALGLFLGVISKAHLGIFDAGDACAVVLIIILIGIAGVLFVRLGKLDDAENWETSDTEDPR